MTSALIGRARQRAHPRETELLARAQRGDVLAFEQLAGAHVSHLFAATRRLVGDRGEAEDIVQETLLRAWRGIAGFRGRSEFFTWLYRIAVNEANRSLQKGARRSRAIALAKEELSSSSASDNVPARNAELRELLAALRAALLTLPGPSRTAVVLRDIEGLSTREAARLVGVGEAAFKSRLHEARLKLRAALGDDALITIAG